MLLTAELNYFDIFISILTLFCVFFYTWIIFEAKSLRPVCRLCLFLSAFSMFLLATSQGLTAYENFYANRIYDDPEFYTSRLMLYFSIHEAAFCFQTLTFFIFSIERVLAIYGILAQRQNLLFIIFVLVFVLTAGASLVFSYTIHFLHHTAEPTIIISSIDILGLSLQIVTWHHAKVQYSKTVGSAPLEQRFRMANVYKWTLTLFPSSIFAVIVKTFSIGMIWIYITQEKYDLENGYRSLYFVFVFKNLQAAYAISLPFIILSTNSQLCRKFRAKFCGAKRKVSPKTVKTLEGKEIRRNFRTTAEYFENLRNGWEKF